MMVAEAAAVQPIHEDQLDHEKHTNSADVDQLDHHGGGNRWPRQETLALLKIRSEMDATFRDSSLKAPLWEDVSRKLGEQGYQRSAKKCREKFENVYKYHRRTKEGRSGKPQGGKNYRFFDELEAFDHQQQQNSHNPSTIIPPKPPVVQWTINSTNTNQNGVVTPTMDNNYPIIQPSENNNATNGFNLFSSSTSSATASDDEFQLRKKRKRKWKYLFRRMTKRVLEEQERLQERFLEAVARCDQDQMAKEEAWRMQEIARLDRQHEALVQERSTAAAKHAALVQFLHNVSLQRNANDDIRSIEINDAAAVQVINAPRPPLQAQPVSWAIDQRGGRINATSFGGEIVAPRNLEAKNIFGNGHDNNNNNSEVPVSSSRWPKTEVQALINLRTNLDVKYHDAGPKGSLWEEISAGMRRLGYDRSSKRCKEKWENINKYFKKVKESSKTRPEDSKTCPYFHQLEALYRNKNNNNNNNNKIEVYSKGHSVEKLQPIVMMRENVDQDQEEDDEHDHHGEQEGESTEEDQGLSDQIGIVTSYNKTSSMEIVES